MLLEKLLTGVNFQTVGSLAAREVTGLVCDSRLVKPGDLFFAVSGTRENGLQFAGDAEKKGAVAVVHDSSDRLVSSIPHIRVANVRMEMCRMATRFFDAPSRDFYLTGVTGTNGKTTFTYLMDAFAASKKSGVIGTVKVRFADRILDTSHTTPDAITLQALFYEMKKQGVTTVAMEVSSHALEQFRAHGSQFDCAVFTNLTQDHLDFHKDMESYFQAKLKLFTECLRQSDKPRKRAVINMDSPYGLRILKSLVSVPEVEVVTYSCQNAGATLFLQKASYDFTGTHAELKWEGKTLPFFTNLIGMHNMQNIMAALLAGLHQGYGMADMLEKLREIRVPGRLERVGQGNVFVDYAHSPDALENVVGALQKIRQGTARAGRIVVLFGCGGDRDQGKRGLMGEIAAKHADVVLVTSDNPRTEDPREIINDILEGVIPHMQKYDGNRGYLIEVDRETALEELVRLAGPDDIVLVAGKGHEDYQIIGTEKRYFDDREILANLLK